jgi:uncharacterized protein (DUF1330 family)
VAILPQTWHVVRKGVVHRITGTYNTDNHLFIEHESAECAFCQITKTYQPIDKSEETKISDSSMDDFFS